MSERRTVTVPACRQHNGLFKITVDLLWECPVCSGPRGEISRGFSYDGSRRMVVSTWENPCGHIDKYDAVLNEIENAESKVS